VEGCGRVLDVGITDPILDLFDGKTAVQFDGKTARFNK
jgi:hypothetical protein